MLRKTTKTPDQFKADITSNLMQTFNVVHDEWDLLVDSNILQPISIKMVKIFELRQVFDKIGYSFVRFGFDVEYDNHPDSFGSFVPNDKLDVYQLRCDRLLDGEVPYENEEIPEPVQPIESAIKTSDPVQEPTQIQEQPEETPTEKIPQLQIEIIDPDDNEIKLVEFLLNIEIQTSKMVDLEIIFNGNVFAKRVNSLTDEILKLKEKFYG